MQGADMKKLNDELGEVTRKAFKQALFHEATLWERYFADNWIKFPKRTWRDRLHARLYVWKWRVQDALAVLTGKKRAADWNE